MHTAKKEMTRWFFVWKKGFLQVLLIPEIAVCSERVIWVGINMEKGSSARRDPLTYWVTLMSGKGGLFPGQGGLGKVCWGPCEASLQVHSFPLWSFSLLLCKAFLSPCEVFLSFSARLFSSSAPCEAFLPLRSFPEFLPCLPHTETL